MKTIILLLTIFILGCSSLPKEKKYLETWNTIQYMRFGKMQMDWYIDYEFVGNYLMYTKNTMYGIQTNYVYGDFKIKRRVK